MIFKEKYFLNLKCKNKRLIICSPKKIIIKIYIVDSDGYWKNNSEFWSLKYVSINIIVKNVKLKQQSR